MLLVDGTGNLGVVRPKAHLVALLGHMPGNRGTPRAGADHADALLHHITYFDFLTENLLSCPWASFLMLERWPQMTSADTMQTMTVKATEG